MPTSRPKSPPAKAFAARQFSNFRRLSWSELKLGLQFLFCVCGIYACFGIWSHKQERVVTLPYHIVIAKPSSRWGKSTEVVAEEYFPGVWSLVFLQSVSGFVLAFCGLVVLSVYRRVLSASGKRSSKVSPLPPSVSASLDRKQTGPSNRGRNAISRFLSKWDISSSSLLRVCKPFSVLCFSNAFGSCIGYCAMRLVPYPVYLAAKMGKTFPVMFIGYFFLGARYSRSRVLLCTAVTLSIYFFYFLSPPPAHTGPSSGTQTKMRTGAPKTFLSSHSGEVGMLLLGVNLIMDGITNATQDGFLRTQRKRWNGLQLMGAVNFGTSLWLLLAMGLAELPLRFNAATAVDFSVPPSSSPFSFSQLWPGHDASQSIRFMQRHREAAKDIAILSLLSGVGQFFIFFTITLLGTLTLTIVTLVRKAGSVGVSIVLHKHPVQPMQGVALLSALSCAFLDTAVSIRGAAHSVGGKGKPLRNGEKRREISVAANVVSKESTAATATRAAAPQGRQSQKSSKSATSSAVSQEDNKIQRSAATVESTAQGTKDDIKNGGRPLSPPLLLPSTLYANKQASGVHLSQKGGLSPPLQAGVHGSSSSDARHNETAGGAQPTTPPHIMLSSSSGKSKLPPLPQQHVESVPIVEAVHIPKNTGVSRRRR